MTDFINPNTIVEKFNDYINNQDLKGLYSLMSEDHVFIDRDGKPNGLKSYMIDGWNGFFDMFRDYRNTFKKFKSVEDEVYVLGFAFWSKDKTYDLVIWRAKIEGNLIKEWQIFEDTDRARKKFNL